MTENAFKIVIPARYESSRFPGKPLADIDGKPMIRHVYERAVESGADEVIVATDSTRIGMAAEDFGATVCMTLEQHRSGTERIGEVVDHREWSDDTVVVNLQGDEPLIPAEVIRQLASNLTRETGADCATLYNRITAAEAADENVVKIVTDANGYAMYFSRAVIPFARDVDDAQAPVVEYKRHIGMYAYRAGLLRRLKGLARCDIEEIEKLEQLRLLWHGMHIHCDEAVATPGHGVDTPEDLEKVRAALSSRES